MSKSTVGDEKWQKGKVAVLRLQKRPRLKAVFVLAPVEGSQLCGGVRGLEGS